MIKNLRCLDLAVQLAAEPPYRFTFEYEEITPVLISAEIRDEKGVTVWEEKNEAFKIPYVLAKAELERCSNYTFNLVLTDAKGNTETAFLNFKTGLMGDFEGAQMIGASFADAVPVLYKSFEITDISNGLLYLLPLGFFKCYINGKEICDEYFGTGSDYHKRDNFNSRLTYPLTDEFSSYSQYYRVYDVSELLEVGENHIAVMLGNGWYNQYTRTAEGHMEYGEPRFKMLLKTAADKLVSDDSFVSFESPIIYSHLFIGEFHDLTQPIIPLLFGDSDFSNSVVVYPDEEAVLRPAYFPPDRVIKEIIPKKVGEYDGKALYDAGVNLTGIVEVTTAAEEGERITLEFGSFVKDGTMYTNPCGLDLQTDTFIASGSENCVFSPLFVWHGFRYFTVEGYVNDLKVLVIQSDIKPEGIFISENCQMLNNVVSMYQNSQWSNMHCGVPSDCPHRERLGYTGDGQVIASSAMYLADNRAFYRKWLRDIADGQCKKTGHIQHTAPFNGGAGGPAGWGGAIVIVPWQYYLHYGEKDILEEYFGNMLRYVDYMEEHSENNLVTSEDEKGWFLGDWATVDEVKLNSVYVNTCLYIRLLDILIQIAEILDQPEKAEVFKRFIDVKSEAVKNEFLKDGVWDTNAQGAPVFAYAAGIATLEEIRPYLESYKNKTLDTGFIGTPLLINALFDAGMGDTAIELLVKDEEGTFGYMYNFGYTTLGEYLKTLCASDNHPMFGAFTAVLIERLLGVRLSRDTAGFTGDCFGEPVPGYSGKIFTPNGYITLGK